MLHHLLRSDAGHSARKVLRLFLQCGLFLCRWLEHETMRPGMTCGVDIDIGNKALEACRTVRNGFDMGNHTGPAGVDDRGVEAKGLAELHRPDKTHGVDFDKDNVVCRNTFGSCHQTRFHEPGCSACRKQSAMVIEMFSDNEVTCRDRFDIHI